MKNMCGPDEKYVWSGRKMRYITFCVKLGFNVPDKKMVWWEEKIVNCDVICGAAKK